MLSSYITMLLSSPLVKVVIALHIYNSIHASLPDFSLHIAGMSVKGKRPSQQDVFYVRAPEKAGEDGYCAGIFDGGGEYGGIIAKQVSTIFLNQFNDRSILSQDTITRDLETIFNNVNIKLKELAKFSTHYLQRSGTTALIAYKLGSLLYIAHCGDSLAVWGSKFGEKTVDHSTENADEIDRYTQDEHEFDPDDKVTKMNNGTTLTRGFGYVGPFMSGWTEQPNITVIDLQKYPIIIMGSDGLWDYISYTPSYFNEILHGIKNDVTPENMVCKKLIRVAIQVSSHNITLNEALNDDVFVNNYQDTTLRDNTTVVVIRAVQASIKMQSEEPLDNTLPKNKPNNDSLFSDKQKIIFFTAAGMLLLCFIRYMYWK